MKINFFSSRSLKINHAIYNSDSRIQISLFPGKNKLPENAQNPEFEGYVTIVKKNEKKQDKCIVKSDGNTNVWSNYKNNYELYKNNLHCIYNLLIPPNSEVFVTSLSNLEIGNDVIVFYDEKNNSHLLPKHHTEYFLREFMLFSKNVTAGSNFTFEFVSDGSLQWGGFLMNFTVISKLFKGFMY